MSSVGHTKHLLTVSVEDYFHSGSLQGVVAPKYWARIESRLEKSIHDTIDLLGEHQIVATFFVLGWIAERQPEIVRMIRAAGHEIASRGFGKGEVRSPQALGNLRAMRAGDRAVIYHSGERRAVGIAEVVHDPSVDPSGGEVRVEVRAVRPLPAPVPLEALKTEPTFEGSVLLRQGRLSVVPLSPAEWRDLEELSDVIARTGGLHDAASF